MYDLIIIGSGPAGLTAAIYASRASLKTLVLAGEPWGGQLMLTTEVENYPGFPQGIQGPNLMIAMRQQAERFGAEILDKKAAAVDFKRRPFRVFLRMPATGSAFQASHPSPNSPDFYQGKALIIATGAEAKWLGVPGEKRLIGKGVSSCAPCDAFFFKNKRVAVIGGGDSAMEEALVLIKFAKELTIVHRRSEFRASKILQQRILKNKKIKILRDTQVLEILGKERVEGVRLGSRFKAQGSRLKSWEMAIDGVFVAIGHQPKTEIFTGQVALDEKGYVIRNHKSQIPNSKVYQMMTSVPGVFVAGDVHDYHYRQAVTATGYGCMAALEVERWLEEGIGKALGSRLKAQG